MNKRLMFEEFYTNLQNAHDIDPGVWMSQYLVERTEMNRDQVVWFCFLQAITYHLPTAFLLFNEYPDSHLVDIDRLTDWWSREVQMRCPYQTDKLKQRKYLPETVESYQRVIGMSDSDYFDSLLAGDGHHNFDILWEEFFVPIAHFGRFSTWNFAQNLKQIAGYDIEPAILFLGESNATSITHGICHVAGWEDKTFKHRWKTPEGKKRKKVYLFSEDEKLYLERKAQSLKDSLSADSFDLETVLCAFKKLFRTRDSRYIGYYLDRQAQDINKIRDNDWTGVPWYLLDQARAEVPKVETLGVTVDKTKFTLDPTEKIK